MTARRRAVAIAAGVAWLGFFVHNVADLPGVSLLAPEYTIPTAVWIALLALWWAAPDRRGRTFLLLAWTLLNVAGAILTVLPLGALPFRPEQSVRHYAFHAVYLLAQVPLLALLARPRGAGSAGPGPGGDGPSLYSA